MSQFKRLSKATTALKFKAARSVLPAAIGKAEETNLAIEYNPAQFYELIRLFNENFSNIPQVIKEARLLKETKTWYLRILGLHQP